MKRLLLALAAILAGVTFVASAQADTATLTSSADQIVQSWWPTYNAGAGTDLYINQGVGVCCTTNATNQPAREAYVRFNVSVPAGATITGATLRMYATELHPEGVGVFGTSSSWTETGLVWNNRPAATTAELYRDTGTTLGWRDFSVGVVGSGAQSFLLRSYSPGGLSHYSSREGANAPQLVVTYTPAAPPPPPPPGTGMQLATSGHSIVNAATGANVLLHGANVMNSEWNGTMANERQGLPLLASNWKGNIFVRGFAADPVNARSSSYLAFLDEEVSIARANHMYVVFAFRSFAINGGQPTQPDGRATSALTYLAQRYKAEPEVLFELQVEPHGVAWSTLRPLFEGMVDSIRGPNGSGNASQPLIFVPGINYSNDVSGALTNPVSRPDVVYGVHPYTPQANWQHDWIGPYDSGLPVFVGEFTLDPNLSLDMTAINNLLSITRGRGIGWTAWIFDTCGCTSGQEGVITSWSTASPRSPFGVAVRNEMLSTPPLP